MGSTLDIISAIILGVVQALTEFFPVSSSAHLVLAGKLLGVESKNGVAFEVAVHIGTLFAVLIVFRKDFVDLSHATLRGLRRLGDLRAAMAEDPALLQAVAVLVGCVPAGLIGVFFKDAIESVFHSTLFVCWGLVVTGLALTATRFVPQGDRPITLRDALLIGCAQAVSILPGVSRSGSTICAGIFLGNDRLAAARFSFLMSVPIVAGAVLLKTLDVIKDPPGEDFFIGAAIGAGVSFVVGLGVLALLMRILKLGRFAEFGWYCFAVASWGFYAL